ncbi:MAG: GNAT family N-acetyltransferase [Chloroflexota bacterium]
MATFRRLTTNDLPRLRQFWLDHWGGDEIIVHGVTCRPEQLDGFTALDGEEWMGLVTFVVADGTCEIVSLDSLREGQGIGARLIEEVVEAARRQACRRVFLVTTNDNLHALGFYQRHGFRLVAIRPGAVDEARKVKPAIPLVGRNGIPLLDEIELELSL